MIAGRISEQNFNTMLEKTQTEQTELKTKVSEGRKRPVSYTHLDVYKRQGMSGKHGGPVFARQGQSRLPLWQSLQS